MQLSAATAEAKLKVFRRDKPGAIVVCDNTAQERDAYADYFAYLKSNGFSTITLPFAGGLEMSVRGTA